MDIADVNEWLDLGQQFRFVYVTTRKDEHGVVFWCFLRTSDDR